MQGGTKGHNLNCDQYANHKIPVCIYIYICMQIYIYIYMHTISYVHIGASIPCKVPETRGSNLRF